MLARKTRIALEIFGGALALALLAGGVALWRLASAPVDVAFLTPYVEEALGDPEDGITVEVAETLLVWQPQQHKIHILARDLVVRDRNGAAIGALPEAAVGLSLRALVQGVAAPTFIEARSAAITLVRHADGSISVGRGTVRSEALPKELPDAAPSEGGDFDRLLPVVLERLSAPADPDDPISFLRTVRVTDGRVALLDERLGVVWTARRADITLRRDPRGVSGAVTFALGLGGTRADFSLTFVHDAASGLNELTGRFSGLSTGAVAAAAPPLSPFVGVELPLSGNLSASLDSQGRLLEMDFSAEAGAGSLSHAELLPDPLPLASAAFSGRFVRNEGIFLDAAEFVFGDDSQNGPTVTLAGSIKGLDLVAGAPVEIAGEAQVVGMPAELLDRYWPKVLAPNAREWVVPNVPEGLVEKAEATFSLGLDSEGAAVLHEVDGSFVFRDLAVHYLRPLPPVEGIAGTARFDADTMTFEATAGHLDKLKVQSGNVQIIDLQEELTSMTVAVKVAGPVADALTLLDHPRLDLLTGLGIDPASTGGRAEVDLDLAFPLPKDLQFEQIDLAAKAHLENASAKRILLDQDVTEGTLDLVVDRQGMTVTGPLRYAGIPLEAEWREEFSDKAAFTSRVSAKVPRVVEEDWRRFGIEPAPLLSGPVSGSLVVTARGDGSGEVSTSIDLQEARLQIAPLLWKKPQGKAGTADLLLTWRPGHPLAIPRIEVDAGTLYARGRAELAEDKALALLELDRLAYEGTDLQGVRVHTVGEGYKVRIVGGVLDAAPFLAEDEAVEQVASSQQDVAPAEKPAEEEAETPLDLEAQHLVRLSVGPERYLEGVSLSLRRDSDGWDEIAVNGEVPRSLWSAAPGLPPDSLPDDHRRFRFEFAPDGADGHTLTATADDLGAVLRALDLIDTVHGGRLEITGQSDPAVSDGPVNARIEAKDYVLVEAPVLAKLLTLASLTGISDTLSGEGIRFERLVGEFTLNDGVIETELVRAYGPALGLTAEGTVDIDGNAVDLNGTVVPAYTINRVLGAIPLVGPIITGGEGEGLLAFTYRANGPLDNPEVSVNPLSVLAPGFLRSLFGIFSSDGGNDGNDPSNPPRALPQPQGRDG